MLAGCELNLRELSDSMYSLSIRKSIYIFAIAVVFMQLFGCGGGSDGGGDGLDPNLDPPGNLSIAQGMDFDTIIISWTPPPMEITGYDIEGRFNDEPFEKQNEIPHEGQPSRWP